MPDFEIQSGDVATGYLGIMRHTPSDREINLHVTTALKSSVVFKAPVGDLVQEVDATLHTIGRMSEQYSSSGLRDALTNAELYKPVGKAVTSLRTTGITQQKSLADQMKDWATPVAPPPFRDQLITQLASMKPVESFELALDNYEAGAAIAEGGETFATLMRWRPEMFPRFHDVFVERNLALRLEGQQSPRLDVDDLLNDKPDAQAARAEARTHLAAHKAKRAELDEVRTLLGSTVDLVALALDTSRASALAALIPA